MGSTPPGFCSSWISPMNYARIAQALSCDDPQPANTAILAVCMLLPPFNVLQPYVASLEPRLDPALAGGTLHAAGSRDNRAPSLSARVDEPQVAQTALYVSGRIFLDGGAELRPFYQVVRTDSTRDRPSAGPYRLELRGAEGDLLVAHRFAPRTRTTHGRPAPALSFQEIVPWHPATAQVVLRLDERVLAERAVSASVPTVTLLSPNGGESWESSGEAVVAWIADDRDGDPLHFWLEYSADGGRTWELIERNLQGGEYRLDLRNFAGSERALIRILATDGVNTGMDMSDAVFTVAPKAPLVAILLPDPDRPRSQTEAVRMSWGGQLRLRSAVVDHEDATFPAAALVWTSDRDGELGRGPELLAQGLTVGDHVLTLTATDHDGYQGSAQLRLSVAGPVPAAYRIPGGPIPY
jgi:hypothetical protein